MKTFRQLWMERGKATVGGNVWDVWDTNPGLTEVILLRSVPVQGHFKRGKMTGGGLRYISIRRPIDSPAVEAL